MPVIIRNAISTDITHYYVIHLHKDTIAPASARVYLICTSTQVRLAGASLELESHIGE
jgi:hypothetical protein